VDMLFVELAEGTLFDELVKVAGHWLWHNGRIGTMSEVAFGCSDRVAVEEVKDKMRNTTTHCMMWLTSQGVDCCEGFVEPCSIF
jgi:hypothetical protein